MTTSSLTNTGRPADPEPGQTIPMRAHSLARSFPWRWRPKHRLSSNAGADFVGDSTAFDADRCCRATRFIPEAPGFLEPARTWPSALRCFEVSEDSMKH